MKEPDPGLPGLRYRHHRGPSSVREPIVDHDKSALIWRIRLRLSHTPFCSTNLPLAKRKKQLLATRTKLPEAGIPPSGPLWVPVNINCTDAMSPSGTIY